MINALQLTLQSSVNPSSVVVWNLDGAQPDRWPQMLSPKTRENPWICYAQSSVKVGINWPMSRQFWSGKRKRSCCLKGEHKKELKMPKIQFQSHQRMSRMRKDMPRKSSQPFCAEYHVFLEHGRSAV